ncbi:MAG TPA: hypothetical protein VKO83_12515, partial [Steroidobacteraceae bacterium]|nr:hypothetical protein [Steroidobacteraceae bacterium]
MGESRITIAGALSAMQRQVSAKAHVGTADVKPRSGGRRQNRSTGWREAERNSLVRRPSQGNDRFQACILSSCSWRSCASIEYSA